MKRVNAGLVAVLLSIALLAAAVVSPVVSSAEANDLCGESLSMICPAQPGTMKLAAEMPLAKLSHRHDRCGCTGKFGTALKKCQCECQGTSEFPCHFQPATSPQNPAACLCR